MTAVIYARYSTDLQNDRSVEDQIAYCAAFAARQGLAVTATYDDRAVSGQRFHDRLGLQRLLRDAKAGLFKTVIVENADRLSRHPGDIHTIREALEFRGVTIMQVTAGELSAMQAAVSGLVSTVMLQGLKEKIWRGMTGNVREGKSAGGRAYGYAPVKGEPGHLVIVEAEAEVIRRVFANYLDGIPPVDIAGALNRERVLPPRGSRWNASTIHGSQQRGNGILGNELYKGVRVWNKVRMVRDPETRRRVSRPNPPEAWQRIEVPELAIVTPEVFDAAQARRNGPRGALHRSPKRILSGLLKCACCGGGMSIKDYDHGRPRVQCSTYAESRTCRNGKTMALLRIEAAVIEGVRQHLDAPELIEAYVEAYNAERRRLARARTDNRDANTRALLKTEADLNRAIALLVEGVASPETLRPRIAALEAEKRWLERELAAPASAPVLTLKSTVVARYRQQLADLATALNDEGPKLAFRRLVERVTVTPDYTIETFGDLAPLFGESTVAGERLLRTPLPFSFKAAA